MSLLWPLKNDFEMEERSLATRVVDAMFDNDPFSKWLGIERMEDGPGSSMLRMRVRDEMLNGFAIAHGGIAYSLADTALAFAANGHGVQSVSIETSISHVRPVRVGDILTATARELSLTGRLGIYEVTVSDVEDRTVALFKGTVFRTGQDWEV
jgi:acyl-CoA thioesterase